jgi:hypothetical protein
MEMAQVKISITTLEGVVLEMETIEHGGTDIETAKAILEVLSMRFDVHTDTSAENYLTSKGE